MQATPGPLRHRGAHTFRTARRTLSDIAFDVRSLLCLSSLLIVGTLVWCMRQSPSAVLAYADVPTHLNLARRVHDDLHAGLGQLGDYWLPLSHVLELPFVWNDTLWHSGLAGSIPSMACYLVSVWCIYQLVFLATGERPPATIAGLAFAANPNILYLDVLPMFEPSIIAGMLLSTYALARWLQSNDGYADLVVAAAIVCVATTSRYEMWGYAAASAVVVAAAFWQRGDRGARLRGHILFYILLAWYGMTLWLLWNLSLNGDPFYFLHPTFNKGLPEDSLAILTKRHLLKATAYVLYSVADNAGWLLTAIAVAGLWRAVTSIGVQARSLWLYLLATPAGFDMFYLWYKGTPPILVPELIPHAPGNIRYGAVSIPLICILIGVLARRPFSTVPPVPARFGPTVARLWNIFGSTARLAWPAAQMVLLGAALLQPVLLLRSHDVVSYNEAETPRYVADQQARVELGHWLGSHYAGGYILMSTFKGADRIILASGLADREFIHEGSQNTWKCALRVPQRWVRWVVLFNRGDGAATLLRSRSVSGGVYFARVSDIPRSAAAYYYVYERNSNPWRAPFAGQCE